MTDIIQAIEIFAAVTGVLYVVLEILQKNSMWVVGILTGAACAFSFGVQQVWASMGLNIYYMVISVVGLIRWKKAREAVEEGEIHLCPLPRKVGVWSVVLFYVGSLVLIQVLRTAGDAQSFLDGTATMLSVIATWWLAQSYLEQWLLWILADILSTILCMVTGQYAMALMYLAYTASAIYGYFHWKKHGKYVTLQGGAKGDSSLRSE